jgi:hypothetical protein
MQDSWECGKDEPAILIDDNVRLVSVHCLNSFGYCLGSSLGGNGTSSQVPDEHTSDFNRGTRATEN